MLASYINKVVVNLGSLILREWDNSVPIRWSPSLLAINDDCADNDVLGKHADVSCGYDSHFCDYSKF